MSKGIIQRKSSLRREPTMVEDETNRRKLEKDKYRRNQSGNFHETFHQEQRNGNNKYNKSDKLPPKNHTEPKPRPSSAKSLLVEEEDNHSGDPNKSIRLSRSNRKDDQQNGMVRSISLHSSSRAHSNNARSSQNAQYVSDKTKTFEDRSSEQLKKLLIRLSSEFNDLESLTGFKSNKPDSSSNTCCTSLATALLRLTGHVKQCATNSKEINYLKDQLSMMFKNQLDFQDKIQNQITTLQTMMQTICQLVNKEIISNRKSYHNQMDLDNNLHTHQNWLNNAQKPYLLEKDTTSAMDQLFMFTPKINNASPIDSNLFHSPISNSYSTFTETLEATKRLLQPTPSVSVNNNDISKQTQQVISPIDVKLNENENAPASIMFQTREPSAISTSETLLEKILHERLRLVQQMNELNKQHEMTQEELANLESKTIQL